MGKNRLFLEQYSLVLHQYFELTQNLKRSHDRNQIANFTYFDYNANIDIGDKPSKEYVPQYWQKLGEDGYRKICAENALPDGFEDMSCLDFLEKRRKLMAGVVKQA